MHVFRRSRASLALLIVPVLLGIATPAWSQVVTADKPQEPEARKVSKVEAITVKQKVAAAAYMKLGDIKGESTATGHTGHIDVLSYSWGASQIGPVPAGSGGGTLTITKAVDRSTPQLTQASTSGRRFDQMTLTLPPRAGESARVVTLEGVVIKSVQRSSGGDVPTESISFNYTKIK